MGVVVVVAVAGVMSGLTLGLLSMDRLDLELMLRTGNTKQERFARRCVRLHGYGLCPGLFVLSVEAAKLCLFVVQRSFNMEHVERM